MSSYTCENFQNDSPNISNFVRWSKTPFFTFCAQKTRKIKFLGRGVILDEFLHMWELSTFHVLQFWIWSYVLKMTSYRSKPNFWDFSINRSVYFLIEYSVPVEYSTMLKFFFLNHWYSHNCKIFFQTILTNIDGNRDPYHHSKKP